MFGNRHVIVIEEKAYVNYFLATMTVMTLVTRNRGRILHGAHLYS
jgi:hypothetical protein